MLTLIDKRNAQLRALDIAGGAGQGGELIDESISGVVQNIALRHLGLLSALRHEPAEGTLYQTPNRTPGNGGGWVDDNDTAVDGTGAYVMLAFTIKTILVEGKVSRRLIGAGRTYTDVLAKEIHFMTRDASNKIENGIINRDGTLPKEPVGFLRLISNTATQVISNSAALGGANLVDGNMQKAIDVCVGGQDAQDMIICCSLAGRREIGAVASSQNRYQGEVEYGIGFKAKSYESIPLIISTGMLNTYKYLALQNALTFAAGEAEVSAVAGEQTTAIMVMNTLHCFLAVATPLTFMQLDKFSSQYSNFHIFADLCPVVDNSLGASLVVGVKV